MQKNCTYQNLSCLVRNSKNFKITDTVAIGRTAEYKIITYNRIVFANWKVKKVTSRFVVRTIIYNKIVLKTLNSPKKKKE